MPNNWNDGTEKYNLRAKLDKAEALNLRWNRAMSKFAAGSEFIDDPERVAEHIERCLYFHDLLRSRKEAL